MSERKETILQLVKSLLITTVFCVVIAMMTSNIWPSPFYEHIIISLGYGYSAVLCSFVLENNFPTLKKAYSTVLAMVLSITLGTFHASLWLNKYDDFATLEALQPIVLLGLIFTAICFYYFHATEKTMLAEQALALSKRKQLEQEKALVLSQLSQLQSQIEPHFLFNTLANISALIELDSNKAKLMLEKLTDLLRGSLKTNRNPLITVEQEIELLNAYLSIQQIRLGDRLTYNIDNQIIEPISLPPLLIQPLVENAITHGIEPSAQGGQLMVQFKQENNQFIVVISDNGIGLESVSPSKGHGMSLNNIKQRLHDLFDGSASVRITENKDGGVNAELIIPSDKLLQLNKEYS
ncbi:MULTISPECIES: sensor histidine kinase [Aliivibrio]|uniref:Sensor histidine kinase n=1 Tax=Aliivibrio finisterrensis TaxID=511998 RepID=A0A4Q5KRQ5_9GAMM|nr:MULTISPECIES: histidine kinase [Aliivibrio]MDD9180115.1 histidine kinase [Aliivibrio sp. A6]RYU49724.1 sensor histidine kinase [Aliivibrio finisterrensis]RYU50392.1 sensor histidine kinase [Aliivibrio finisterrensis]RYU56284.1 sensor histidine kinase [Aliivibrio finisterrensis]RYU62330.1 sensor histidine kinase [Aliivibrio finisterrensis]